MRNSVADTAFYVVASVNIVAMIVNVALCIMRMCGLFI